MSIITEAPIRLPRPRAAQFESLANHAGTARMLTDLGMHDHAKAEMELVQTQLKYLAVVDRIIAEQEAGR